MHSSDIWIFRSQLGNDIYNAVKELESIKDDDKKKDRIQQLNQQIFNFKKSKVDEYTKLYEKNNNIEVMKKYITSLYIIIYFTILF